MSFLETLFDFPSVWENRWIIDGEGALVYRPPAGEKATPAIAPVAKAVVGIEEVASLSHDALPVASIVRDAIIAQQELQEAYERSEAGGAESAEVVVAELVTDVESVEVPVAELITDVSADPVVAEVVPEAITEDEAIASAAVVAEEEVAPSAPAVVETPVAPKKDDKKKDHGGGHGHKKEPKEMSPVELAGIAASCNAKVLTLIMKKGGDAALVAAMQNPAMDGEKVVWILSHRAPAAATLAQIGRSRFVRDKVVAGALCKNPKTPLHLSRSLVGRLGMGVLKEIVRAPGLPQALKGAARMKLDKKKKKH